MDFEPCDWFMSWTFKVKLVSYARTIWKSINDTWIEWYRSLCNDFQGINIVPSAFSNATSIVPRMCQIQIIRAATNIVFIPHANFSIFRWNIQIISLSLPCNRVRQPLTHARARIAINILGDFVAVLGDFRRF